MNKATYDNVGQFIANKEEFKNNQGNFRGEWDGDMYEIWSYNVVIAQWSQGEGWHIADQYYSRTTTRQLNTVKKAIEYNKQAIKDYETMTMIENL